MTELKHCSFDVVVWVDDSRVDEYLELGYHLPSSSKDKPKTARKTARKSQPRKG